MYKGISRRIQPDKKIQAIPETPELEMTTVCECSTSGVYLYWYEFYLCFLSWKNLHEYKYLH